MAARKRHTADLLVVLLLFFVYAGCALLLCALGANTYNSTVAVMQANYDQRSGVLYIAQKVRQNDVGGSLYLDNYRGTDALVLVEQETGTAYETWIFIKDGVLCEQLIAAGAEIIDDQAQAIMPMSKMELSLSEEGLLSVALTTTTGALDRVSLALRSSGGPFFLGEAESSDASVVALGESDSAGATDSSSIAGSASASPDSSELQAPASGVAEASQPLVSDTSLPGAGKGGEG